jgi:hypothetical protein
VILVIETVSVWRVLTPEIYLVITECFVNSQNLFKLNFENDSFGVITRSS